MNWLAIGVGATLGAWLRWALALWLNAFHPHLPLGTLAANLGGGFLMGLALAFFQGQAAVSPEWRLLITTGFLGGLTTFSTFSAEAMMLLQRGDYLVALGHSVLHLIGSILCCIAGFAAYRLISP